MIFTGDVICVYCGRKIKFSGNNISYQNSKCASHNKEHQFPGMNIVVDENSSSDIYHNNLPVITVDG